MPLSRPIRLALLTACLSLGACNTPPERQDFPDITFVHLAPFKLDVAHVEIVQAYRPDPANDIADQFPVVQFVELAGIHR